MTRDELGSYPADPEGSSASDVSTPTDTSVSPDATASAELAVDAPKRRAPAVVLIAVGVVAVFALGLGAWFFERATLPVPVPALVSLTPDAASRLLIGARLREGRATYRVTKDFPAGRIIGQSPAPYTNVAQGSPVNIAVAISPRQAIVPDVVGAVSSDAQAALEYELFVPTVLYAYSPSMHSGEVIEQLPRAGDTASTGSADVIVVSLGPGTPGVVVPQMVGETFVQASREASNTRLFASPRAVTATGTPDGVVVDQAPSAGLTVPVGSNVWVSVADSRAGK
ncbi:MAG: PASTA domain-containing protein [Coriobacteriia bacterium]|nr:PASTA domain-containing protein [Coriobacteriia bacterium]